MKEGKCKHIRDSKPYADSIWESAMNGDGEWEAPDRWASTTFEFENQEENKQLDRKPAIEEKGKCLKAMLIICNKAKFLLN